jgi:hypothetical protein
MTIAIGQGLYVSLELIFIKSIKFEAYFDFEFDDVKCCSFTWIKFGSFS